MLEKFFHLKEKNTNVKTEVIAGLTTFMTMAYILAVNPSILGVRGMDTGAIFTATALASAIASFCMALFANLPFVLSAGMGLNAYFAYTVCGLMGYSWQVALTAVLVEGLIFIVLSLTNVREAIFNAIPASLKVAVSVGIGLFICFIGLQNAHIVVDSATLVGMFSFSGSILVTAFLVIKNVKGNILLGILITWGLGIICQLTGLYVPNPDAGFYSLIPSGIVSLPASVSSTLFKFDFAFIGSHVGDFIAIVFAFLSVDIFDTLGTLIGCAAKADLLDEQGRLPGIKGALLADAIGTTCGACLGTSTITTFVESSSGVAEGGRTGLTAVVSGLFFLLALFFSPLFLTIPSFATAPALIVVGFLMMQQVTKLDWNDLVSAIPAFICIFAMPFMYSISEGIISHVILHVLCGKAKNVTPLMYVLAVVFILKYVIL